MSSLRRPPRHQCPAYEISEIKLYDRLMRMPPASDGLFHPRARIWCLVNGGHSAVKPLNSLLSGGPSAYKNGSQPIKDTGLDQQVRWKNSIKPFQGHRMVQRDMGGGGVLHTLL